MTEAERLAKLAKDAKARLGTWQRLGDFLGVTRSQAHKLGNGGSVPTGVQVVLMQDLLKRAACVLFAVLSASQAGENYASGISTMRASGMDTTCSLFKRLLALFVRPTALAT